MFPGSNCDTDAGNAWQELGLGEATYLWHGDTDLQGVEAIIIPGGFTYGDALRAGAIARFAPIMASIARFAEEGGLVAGFCNGFQVLCEAGMLPGGLVRNEKMRFVCRHVTLRVENHETPFTRHYEPGELLQVPVAHGEGRYVCDEETHAQLVAENRIVFRYTDTTGNTSPESNPNGSRDAIAGILGGPANNILGMMPHPERATRSELGSDSGKRVFLAMYDALQTKR
ncbi:MAG: phosphoribosylformylglycinamidine synthase subunit PurQ [Armatimonadaceae bacterium]